MMGWTYALVLTDSGTNGHLCNLSSALALSLIQIDPRIRKCFSQRAARLQNRKEGVPFCFVCNWSTEPSKRGWPASSLLVYFLLLGAGAGQFPEPGPVFLPGKERAPLDTRDRVFRSWGGAVSRSRWSASLVTIAWVLAMTAPPNKHPPPPTSDAQRQQLRGSPDANSMDLGSAGRARDPI